uniref:Reverse transcriptase Ty1/copia-type domain-containing protein n=1 Tax=Fagus sylvatica TaxID=28930 RepID=A0A2N9GS30_FAGSY
MLDSTAQKTAAFDTKTRPHAPPEDPVRRHSLTRASTRQDLFSATCHASRTPLEISLWLKVKFLNPFTSFLIGITTLFGLKDETEDVFALRLEDWDGINHQIITWLRNTSTPSLSMEFGGYDTAKDVWDMLASRYAGSDGAREHHLMITLYQLRQDLALTASGSVPSSDAASFDHVSLTTPTYSIADLQALFSQVQAPSSSASNPALSVTPGISFEWFLDSACYNHMTDNPYPTSAHTPPILPTIITTDGSAMTDSRTGQIVGTERKCTPSTDAPHLSFQNTTPYERLFGTAPNYSLLKVDSLPDLFPEIPSPSVESINPISDESPPTNPSSDEFPTANPTFDESPLSAPAANPVNTTAPEPRRSHWVSTLPSHLRDFHYFSAFATLHEPHTFREASSDPLWQQVMKEELDALLKTEYGIDYEETFAPVARLSSVRTLIAVSASRHWPLFQMDVKNAFLNGELTEEVYMQLPPSFSQPPGFSHKVCRLRRALYGLKQAPRAWFAKFSSTISQHGFSASSYDSALFFRRSDHGITLLLLYVDDMIITGDDVQGIQDLKHFLGQHFEMKDLGPLSYFLGLEVSSSSDGYYLTQAKYTSDLISRAGITDSKIIDTPIEYNNRLNTHDGEPLPDATLLQLGVLFTSLSLRPDISYAVHIVSQFMAAPRSLHYAAVLRILRYLKGTLFHGLHFSSQSSLTLQAYSDADWAGDPTDRRSTTGYCFLLGDSLISWRSKKQSVVARSSTEAEYRALADTTAELFWLRWLLQDLGIDCSTAVLIHCDNRSAIQIAHNDVFHERTKHIEIDCHFVRHHLLQDTLQLRSMSSQDQLADIFTKPMPPGHFP